MNYLLSITPDDYTSNILETKGALETLSFGAQVVLIGLATVFAVLIVLWIALSLFKVIFAGRERSAKEDSIAKVEYPAPVAHTATEDEIVAVIAAAIAMAESESAPGVKFRVVSFRRK